MSDALQDVIAEAAELWSHQWGDPDLADGPTFAMFTAAAVSAWLLSPDVIDRAAASLFECLGYEDWSEVVGPTRRTQIERARAVLTAALEGQ